MTQAQDEAEFARQCTEAAHDIIAILFSYPKPITVCVLPGVLAATMKTLGISRDAVLAMLDSALEDMADAE